MRSQPLRFRLRALMVAVALLAVPAAVVLPRLRPVPKVTRPPGVLAVDGPFTAVTMPDGSPRLATPATLDRVRAEYEAQRIKFGRGRPWPGMYRP